MPNSVMRETLCMEMVAVQDVNWISVVMASTFLLKNAMMATTTMVMDAVKTVAKRCVVME